MSYGTSVVDLDRRTAAYVDKSSRAPSPPICPLSSQPSLS
jgi:hypothetical protein